MPPIPQSPRVLYAKNPLDEVICQLRFPAVLKIDTEEPAHFQESIRKAYPIYEEPQGPASGPSAQLPAEVMKMMGIKVRPVYQFKSEDDRWHVSLSRDFIALSDHDYDRWENFWSHLEGPLAALQQYYQPAFFSRVGLRYRDVVRRSQLALQNVPWPELLKPHVAGELGSLDEKEVEGINRQTEIRLARGRVRLVHGLAKEAETEETVYVIDADFFVEGRTEAKDVQETLSDFHRQAGWLFRWCIGERLHRAMEPRDI